jgi:septal ring factor EnvC (AmiA/AmiB activator)
VEQAISSFEGPDRSASFAVISNSEGDLQALDQTITETARKLADLRDVYKDSYPGVAVLKTRLQQLTAEKDSSRASLEARVARIEQELDRLEGQEVNAETNPAYLQSVQSVLSMAGSREKTDAERAISRARLY